jgi:hypothetical protein
MSALSDALDRAGGVASPLSSSAQLRSLLDVELRRGSDEVSQQRVGYGQPIVVGFAARGSQLVAVCPVAARARVDSGRLPDRGWSLVAATVGALVEGSGAETVRRRSALALEAGDFGGYLALALAGESSNTEMAVLALEDQIESVARLRAIGLALPGHVLDDVKDLRRPAERSHPLLVAEAVGRLAGRPADPEAIDRHEDAILAIFGETSRQDAPHADPDPARRAARRILQRMDGMGKWGGFHTEFRYLARGFQPDQIALALDVGERLMASGLLVEKISVGQRHAFLNPRRAKDIHRLIEDGTVPPDLVLP